MKLEKIFLLLTAAVFIIFGIWGFLAPEAMMSNFNISLDTPDARTAIRSIYGGFLTAIGGLYIYYSLNEQRIITGIWVMLIFTTTVLSFRIISMIIEASISSFHLAYGALEIVGIAFATFLLMREKADQDIV